MIHIGGPRDKTGNAVGYSPAEINPPKSISKYQKFILSNNLFLNYDFGFYYDNNSLFDNFFPNLIEKINEKRFDKTQIMSKKTYFCFQTFNQLLEDFTTARYIFFQSLNLKNKKIDSRVKYICTLDYTKHSLKYGILKSVFATLYNCLDKIANITKYYFSDEEIDLNKIETYFDWFTKDAFKQLVKEKRNFQLLALYSLAIDMKSGGSYYHLNKIRNRITHSFLNINIDIGYDDKYADFEVTEDDLISSIYDLFVIVKSAIMYFLIGIRNTSDQKKTMPMYATMEYDIYK